MIPFTIDGQSVEGKEDGNVLEVALDAGIEIPNLCYHESVKRYGACRLCLVEVVRHGRSRMPPSCTYPVMEGMEVLTRTEKVLRARRMIIELILAMCPGDLLIQDMAKEMGVHEVRFQKEDKDCILCGRWKRTLKMKQCKVCGTSFAPWFQLEKFKEKAKLPKDFFDVCYTCRT